MEERGWQRLPGVSGCPDAVKGLGAMFRALSPHDLQGLVKGSECMLTCAGAHPPGPDLQKAPKLQSDYKVGPEILGKPESYPRFGCPATEWATLHLWRPLPQKAAWWNP